MTVPKGSCRERRPRRTRREGFGDLCLLAVVRRRGDRMGDSQSAASRPHSSAREHLVFKPFTSTVNSCQPTARTCRRRCYESLKMRFLCPAIIWKTAKIVAATDPSPVRVSLAKDGSGQWPQAALIRRVGNSTARVAAPDAVLSSERILSASGIDD